MDALRRQIEYYRARAEEYDEWFYRRGRYDRGRVLNQQWFDEADFCMKRLSLVGRVETALELAAGTGIWTEQLLKIATHVTAVDASQEVLAINRDKLGYPENVAYQQVDLFSWEPERQYDLVSFTFWLSHVPPSLVGEFLSKVYRATKPGGSAWMVDSKRAPSATSLKSDADNEDICEHRLLNDGSSFEIVKVYYTPRRLDALFRGAGFDVEVRETSSYFIHAMARR